MYTITDTNNMVRSYSVKGFDSNARLWDITKDAKDGDVLAIESENGYPSPFIAICKERGLDFFNSHCFVAFDGKFYVGENGHSIEDIHPATKEQCDLLFQKMHDAGYEWNIESKELKKIENKNPMLSDFFRAEYERGKADAQKPAEWSEEDSYMLGQAIKCVNNSGKLDVSTEEIEDWLKSLKDHVQPKPEWSEEDEGFLDLLLAVFTNEHPNGIFSTGDIPVFKGNLVTSNRIIEWLKSLRPQKQWKPSEELITYLYEAIDIIEEQEKYNIVTALRELLEQLKQL
jgi:hypothetical protein